MRLLDAHIDTLTNCMRKGAGLYDNDGHVSLKKLEAFDAPVILYAVFLHKEKTQELYAEFLRAYAYLEEQTEKNKDYMAIVKSRADVIKNMSEGKVSAVPAIEEGGILEGDIKNLYRAHEMGVKYITLTWNFPNEIGEPAKLNGGGLTAFGKELLAEMGNLGVFADVSHLSEAGFWDVHKLSKEPFIASHSNSKALCGHFRNLTDDQLKALGEKGGVAGLNLCTAFLHDDAENGRGATIDDACRHIDRMLKYAGEDGVGIGTDFDGITATPEGLEDVSKLPALREVMQARFGEELTEKIFFGNFMRVLFNY